MRENKQNDLDKRQKQLEEWYQNMNAQFEEDSKTNDYSNPEMDQWFYAMLDEERRKSKRRGIAKVAGIAAGLVIALGIGTNVFTEAAYGRSLIEIIRNSIEAGQFTISAISKNDDSEFEKYDGVTICYEADSIEELFEQITCDTQVEISELFYIENLPDKYKQWTAKYNTKFQMLTINSQHKGNYLFIYEELDYENAVSGTILESEIVSTVFNKNLQMNVDIIKQMEDARNQGYYLDVFYNNKRFLIEGNGSLEEFKMIAENISLVRGK